MIPKGTPNYWTPSSRFKNGFKYEWTDSTGLRCHVHGHTKDPHHTTGNSGTGAVVRISTIQPGMFVEEFLNTSGGKTTSLTSDSGHIPLYH